MPYTNIVTLHHNSERVGFLYIILLLQTTEVAAYSAKQKQDVRWTHHSHSLPQRHSQPSRVVLSPTTQRKTCISPSVTPAQLATPTTEQSASLTDWQFTTTSDKVTPTPSSTASHCLHGTDRRQTSLLRSSGADATGDVSTNETPRKRASSC